jgi:hypothetical protein
MCGTDQYKEDEENLHISEIYILRFSIQEEIPFLIKCNFGWLNYVPSWNF